MKFAFLLVTRGNPQRAAAVIEVAKSLASGKHEIEYVIGVDNDDSKTHSWLHRCCDARLSLGNRPTGVGSVWNRLAAEIKADFYCPFPDDVFIALPDWDQYIIDQFENGILAWNDLTNYGQCTLPIVKSDWLGYLGKLYDERFPYWFYDTCLDEIYTFVYGKRIKIPEHLVIVSKKGLTQNLRELSFWWDFYVATRKERVSLAAEIRKQLGLPEPQIDEIVRAWELRDERGRSVIPRLEMDLTAEGSKPPSVQYLKARQDAAAYLERQAA